MTRRTLTRRPARTLALAGALGLAGCLLVAAPTAARVRAHGASGPRPVNVIPAPSGLVANTAAPVRGPLWVLGGNRSVKTLTEIDTVTHAVAKRIGVSAAASALVQTAFGELGLGLHTPRAGAVELYSATTGALVATKPVAAPVVDLATSPSSATVLALEATGTARAVAVLNALTLQFVRSVPVDLRSVAVVPDGPSSMLVLLRNGEVEDVSLVSKKILFEFGTGGPARALALSPDGRILYVLRFLAHISTVPGVGANVAMVDLATEQTFHVLPAPSHCVAIELSANGRLLYDGVGTPAYGNVQVYPVARWFSAAPAT